MSSQNLARVLGGDVTGPNRILCPGPGHSPRDRSLSVTIDSAAPDGFLVHSFTTDDWHACRDHVRQLLGLGNFEPRRAKGPIRTHRVPVDDTAVRRREFATSIWMEARPIGGTPPETYLARARAIDIPGDIYSGSSIRFHPACPFRLNSGEVVRLPAMVAAMTSIECNVFTGISRTALLPDGSGKAKVRGLPDDGRMMLGSSKSAVVRLTPDEDMTIGLGLAEGIETAMSVMGFGFSPLWATLSAGTLKSLPVLGGVEALTIFADNDASGTGMAAAWACAERWNAAGHECTIWTPPSLHGDAGKGTDFNDLTGRA